MPSLASSLSSTGKCCLTSFSNKMSDEDVQFFWSVTSADFEEAAAKTQVSQEQVCNKSSDSSLPAVKLHTSCHPTCMHSNN